MHVFTLRIISNNPLTHLLTSVVIIEINSILKIAVHHNMDSENFAICFSHHYQDNLKANALLNFSSTLFRKYMIRCWNKHSNSSSSVVKMTIQIAKALFDYRYRWKLENDLTKKENYQLLNLQTLLIYITMKILN